MTMDGLRLSAIALRLPSTAAKPMMPVVNDVPTPCACDENSSHQSALTPLNAVSAARLAPR
jgi:hypothetical protein